MNDHASCYLLESGERMTLISRFFSASQPLESKSWGTGSQFKQCTFNTHWSAYLCVPYVYRCIHSCFI